MKGRSVGTVTGFTLVPELKAVEGIGEVKLYDTSDGVLQDLVAGRLDMAILDPPLVQWGIVQHPEWKLKQVELAPDVGQVSDHVDQIQRDLRRQQGREGARRGDEQDHHRGHLAELHQCEDHGQYGMGDKSWFIPPDEIRARRRPPGRIQVADSGSLLP